MQEVHLVGFDKRFVFFPSERGKRAQPKQLVLSVISVPRRHVL